MIPKNELHATELYEMSLNTLQSHLTLDINGYRCNSEMAFTALVKAALDNSSLNAVCDDLVEMAGANLYFSVVPNGEGWVEAVTTGEIDTTTQAGVVGERTTVPVTLLRVPINGGEATEIATDIAQATLHPSG